MKSFHPRLVLAVLSAGALMQPLDFSIVNLALPAIGQRNARRYLRAPIAPIDCPMA
jgi:hypothetical protein